MARIESKRLVFHVGTMVKVVEECSGLRPLRKALCSAWAA